MTYKISSIASILVLLMFISGGSKAGWAVKCGEPETTAKAFKRATAVFAGEVLDIKSVDNGDLVEFRVERFWKGPQAKKLIVADDIEATGYRYGFKIGEKYLVYAYGPKLATDKCSRTKALSAASDDLKELGEGQEP